MVKHTRSCIFCSTILAPHLVKRKMCVPCKKKRKERVKVKKDLHSYGALVNTSHSDYIKQFLIGEFEMYSSEYIVLEKLL
jgi:hypothetical protein